MKKHTRQASSATPVLPSPRLRLAASGRLPISQFPRLPIVAFTFAVLLMLAASTGTLAQRKRPSDTGSHSSHLRERMTPEARVILERAIEVVCRERKKDPKGSVPIDDMQARPSLPIRSPEAVAGAQRAQRLLPVARDLVVSSLRQLTVTYHIGESRGYKQRLQRALARVRAVKRVRPDMDSRDNASVFLRSPRTITFGTIFLAGLPSDEGMVSVLAHELVHIADGDEDGLGSLFRAVGTRASNLTGLKVHNQRAEELTCDLVGAMATRAYVSSVPSYEPLSRRLARSMEHNCVDDDEGDEDHLSPRNTIRALLALNPFLVDELVNDREERPSSHPSRRY